ncbi:MAG: nucleoside hydrolase [Chloroflexi bacterium]|nr:nucleoside hydrolase [Chloroflexota bacterium]
MALPLLLDVDPGIDDALAILLALASPELDLRAVTVVCGNCATAQGAANARAVLALGGRCDVPVAAGADRPLLRPPMTALETHGPRGLGYARLPRPAQPLAPLHGVGLLLEQVRRQPGELTLVATGPLTNLALALRLEPRLPALLRDCIVMGGALGVPGNVTPVAEFNFAVDPHAAHVVLSSALKPLLVPLDVTHRALCTEAHLAAIQAAGGPVAAFVAAATRFYLRFHDVHDSVRGCYIHDALALALAFAPDLVATREVYVAVETEGHLTAGQAVADLAGRTGRPPTVRAAVEVDAPRFLDLFVERLRGLAQRHAGRVEA